jgi:hypothetical protein
VAQPIAAGCALGMRRQVFMVSLGGFDSHGFQLRDQPLPMWRPPVVCWWRREGGRIHGRMPVAALGTADEPGSGRLPPSTSVTQYAASPGGWMGLGQTDLTTVLPNLGSFGSGGLTLT